MFIRDGSLFLFDNGYDGYDERPDLPDGQGRQYSRAVEFEIDEESLTVEQVWQYGKQRGLSMYSHGMSSVQVLPEGNRYIVSGEMRLYPYAKIRIVEVDPSDSGQVVFEAMINENCKAYRGCRLPLYPPMYGG